MSDVLVSLFRGNTIWLGVWQTVYLTLLSTALAYLIGLPLGVLLCTTSRGGLTPLPWLNKLLGFAVNIFRSIPFLILMVAFLPVAKAIVGKTYGPAAMVVMLVIAAAPYIARMVESSLKEVDAGVVEAAKSMGANPLQIVCKVYLPEARPSLIVGAVIGTVTVLGYSAMASTINGGGLGQIAIFYGYNNFKDDVIWMCVLFTVIIVQIVQEGGMLLATRTDKRVRVKAKRSENVRTEGHFPDGSEKTEQKNNF